MSARVGGCRPQVFAAFLAAGWICMLSAMAGRAALAAADGDPAVAASIQSDPGAGIGPIGDAHFESIEGSGIIADGVVTALAQDREGFLWIGTVQGLLRFDGYRMLHFRHDPDDPASLGADFVRDLLPIADGGLWVATGTGGVSRFDPASGRFRRYRHDPADAGSLGHDGVLSLAAADAEGQSVWLALANAGLDRFDPATGSFVHHRSVADSAASIRHDTVRSLLRDRRGQLWIGTRRGLSRRFADGRFEAVAAGIAELDGQYIYTLFESSDGRIWVGTQGQGGGWIDPQDERWHPLPLGLEANGLAHPWVTDFAEPQPDRIWVATYGTGIDVLDRTGSFVERRIRRDPAVPSSLALDSVTSLFRDASGLLWVGSWGGGLQRHNPAASAFHALHYSPTRPNALSDASVLSALGRADGSIWVGTENQGIDVLDRQRGVIDRFRHDPAVQGSLPAGAISALIERPDGTVWVGTRQAGLHRFDAATRQFLPAPGSTGSVDTRVSGLSALRDGRILLVAESGLLVFDPSTGASEQLRMRDGSAFGLPVLAMAEEADGGLWVGTARGLLRQRRGDAGLDWIQPVGIASAAIQALLVDQHDTLWLASADRLWFAPAPRADVPEFQALELESELPAQLRWSELMSDRQGRFWAGNGVIDPVQRRAWPIGRAEGADVGARTEGMPGRTADGLLLFGGTRGLLIVDPDAFVPWTFEPAVATTELSVDGVAMPWVTPGSVLQLPPSAHRFSVEFTALDLSAPQQNRYRYRLLGADDDWILTDADHRVATYSKLWPGRYELQLSGSNRLGQWSARPVSLQVEVLPAFWQTAWFLLLMLLALGSLIYLGFLARTARIRRQSRELARLVEQRTDELSTAHRALLETQQKLAVQERVAALGGLVAGVAHEVSTPLGVVMTALSGIADAWKQVGARLHAGARSDELAPVLADGEEYTELALRNSDRVGDLVANLKAIVARRDSDLVEVVDLSLHLREASALVGADLRERGCRIEVRVADGLRLATIPDALTEVLARVLRNAVDHAFPERDDGVVEMTAEAFEGGVEIIIRDNGRGISADALGQVFDPFFTTRRGRDGFVGLGLYVAYTQTTQRLKGSIRIHSVAGQGTAVQIRIPDLANPARASG